MDLKTEALSKYIESHISKEPPILKELRRETFAKILMPEMISGHEQGRILSMLSKLSRPNLVLELGTFTGYSTICLAEGLTENGRIYTIDINEELEDFCKKYFIKAGIHHKIIQLVGKAMDFLKETNLFFDLIFLDADKRNYLNYLNLLIERLNPGGLLMADNTLWYGKVLDVAKHNDKDTLAIAAFNDAVLRDKRVETIILPVRDGISLIRKL